MESRLNAAIEAVSVRKMRDGASRLERPSGAALPPHLCKAALRTGEEEHPFAFPPHPGEGGSLFLHHEEGEAERERRAKVIHAEGEAEAAVNLERAAETMARQPIAIQLRYLQTLVEIGSEKNTTVVFPLPMDILSNLGRVLANMAGPEPQSKGPIT